MCVCGGGGGGVKTKAWLTCNFHLDFQKIGQLHHILSLNLLTKPIWNSQNIGCGYLLERPR